MKKIIQIVLVVIIAAATVFCIASCGDKRTDTDTQVKTSGAVESVPAKENNKITITVTVVDDKGESKDFEIATEADNLGDALVEAGLVEGENGPYGLYINSVNGLTADYDEDKSYWAISKNGEYLMTGADSTAIADGEHYELTYTKE